ncbi:MAG: DNA double-strand break repair nuclease NurA [Thermoplasmatota archaeon]
MEEAEAFDAAATAIATRFRSASPPFRFEPIPSRPAPSMAAGVDGSSATILDGGGFRLEAHRSAVAWARAGAVHVEAGALRPFMTEATFGAPTVEEARDAGELAAARSALAKLGPGGMLLLDGSWRGRLPEDLVADAGRRSVAIVSVAKSTSETVEGLPLFAAVRRAARRADLRAPWCCPLPQRDNRFVARFSPAQDRLFLLDVLAGDGLDTLGALVPLGENAGIPGYPYVLALAHQGAVISEEEQRDTVARLLDRAAEIGADASELEFAFHDFHEDLDLGA